jgi:inorganic phosphate transporter, PiT family
MPELTLVLVAIGLALVFDFGNGFHDASNAISTIIATGVLTMRSAVVFAAFFNFIAAFVFGVAVAETIGKGIIDPSVVTIPMIIAGLVAAIVWVYFTVYLGIPISSSHSLIGGLIGAGLVAGGPKVLMYSGILKILIFIVVAPLIGFFAAFFFMLGVIYVFRRVHPEKVKSRFKRLQLISAGVYSLSHGANDAQKTMGIISVVLFIGGVLGPKFYVPFLVIILSHTTIAAGTLMGGWRIVKTMGTQITKLRPIHGFAAETAGAGTIILCTMFGIPVSTTQVIAGGIMGVGTTRRVGAVRWKTARKIVWSWILTIPITAILGGLIYLIYTIVP